MNHRLHQRLIPQGIIAIKVGDGPAKKAGIRKGDIILQSDCSGSQEKYRFSDC
jgi:hypothetical protein